MELDHEYQPHASTSADSRRLSVLALLSPLYPRSQRPVSSDISADIPGFDPIDYSACLVSPEPQCSSPPSPPLLGNDVFLCPPATNKPFTPRKFDTPEEEEAWWCDTRTWPGDHLVNHASATASSLYEIEEPPDSFTQAFIPRFSDNEDHKVASSPFLPDAPLPSVPACPPACLSSFSQDANDSKDSKDSGESAGTIVGEVFPKVVEGRKDASPDGASFDDAASSSSDDDDEEDGADEYLPGAPSHHTRPGPAAARRTAPKPTPSRPCRTSTRVHKPQTTKHRTVAAPPKRHERREFHVIPPEDLAKLRAEQAQLKESGRGPAPFEIPYPVREGARWRCQYVRDGWQCDRSSARSGEAWRHTLTHFNVHYLCGNPSCGLTFARDDAAKRHVTTKSECKKNLPPKVTVESPKATVVVEGQRYRLVQVVPLMKPVPATKSEEQSSKKKKKVDRKSTK